MRIMADTACLYSPAEGQEMGVTVLPVCVAINGETYKDYEEISSEEFLKLIAEGGVPTSSQPAIGDVIDAFEADDEDVLYLSVGDGLSGGYQNAMGARNMMEKSEHIHVLDTKSLAGPHRYLVQKALKLKAEGLDVKQTIERMKESIESSVSFVIPSDFDFLKRSGRLTPIAAKIGGMIKLVPALTQTADKKRIEPFIIKRSWNKAVDSIIQQLKSIGVDENYYISVAHAGVREKAGEVLEQIKGHFVGSRFELLQLSPALTTHGGPGCVVIQAIKM